MSPGSVTSRLVVLLALVIAAAAVSVAAVRALSSTPSGPQVARATLPARPASYLGVYEQGPPHNYQPVAGFGRAAGRQPDLVGYFSGWPEPFATSFARRVSAHGGTTLVQIDPTYASISGIAAGQYDGYLTGFADSVRDYGRAVVVGFGHEMNADWYSWGYQHVPAPVFVAAWRHVVTLFRRQGALNVTWLWTINATLSSTGPIASWWPGAGYVTWIGIDGYYYRRADTFARVFGRTIDQVRALTSKPVLLSETAVGPAAGQPRKIGNLFRGMRSYRTLGLVWFDHAQHNGIYHQDWRLEDHPAAEAAFQQGIRHALHGSAPAKG